MALDLKKKNNLQINAKRFEHRFHMLLDNLFFTMWVLHGVVKAMFNLLSRGKT
jgi:hypothetical protein